MTEQQYQMRLIPLELVPNFWHFAEPYIKRALDQSTGEFSASDIKDYCKSGAMQLWLISDKNKVIAAGTTQILIYPTKKFCRVVTLGGAQSDKWMGYCLSFLEDWAKSQECAVIDAYVRKGFVPKLLQYGFKHKCSMVIKNLT